MELFKMTDGNSPILRGKFQATELNSRERLSEAKLSEIHQMPREDLIRVIVRSRVPFLEESSLVNQETEVLRRLTILAINQEHSPV